MKITKTLLFFAFLFALSSCADDCVYQTYDDLRGDEQCGKFCPSTDEEGNDLLDENGAVVLERTKKVDQINCNLPSASTSTTSTTLTAN